MTTSRRLDGAPGHGAGLDIPGTPPSPLPASDSLAGLLHRVGPASASTPLRPEPGWTPRRPLLPRGRAATVPDATAGDPDGDGQVDWHLVVRLRREAGDRISRERAEHRERRGADLGAEDLRMLGESVIREVVHAHAEQLAATGEALWSMDTEVRHIRVVTDAIFGYGRLQPLFEIPDAENIEINGCDQVLVQFSDGHREERPPVADSDAELVEAIRFLGESADPPRPFDDAHPTMTVALGDRYRLHVIGFGLAHRPSVVIRHHTLTDVGLDDLSATGMMPRAVAVLLRAAVRARRSIVISGDQGAGKTTLLRALVDAIPPTERFGTLETDYELLTHLRPSRRNMIALQATVGLGERVDGRSVGEYTVADLIPEALRQNLSRLVIGEVRGAEAGAMFEAMQTGAGTLSTTHSHSASSTMDRLAARVARGGSMGMEEAYRQIAHNITLLVHVTLVDDTWRGGVRRRYVSEIRQLTGAMESGRPVTHLTYAAGAGPSGAGGPRGTVFHPDPGLLAELRAVDPEIGSWT
nr:CpaF/VirB11 family protein [Acidipropionibacterium acidipropionici]